MSEKEFPQESETVVACGRTPASQRLVSPGYPGGREWSVVSLSGREVLLGGTQDSLTVTRLELGRYQLRFFLIQCVCNDMRGK